MASIQPRLQAMATFISCLACPSSSEAATLTCFRYTASSASPAPGLASTRASAPERLANLTDPSGAAGEASGSSTDCANLPARPAAEANSCLVWPDAVVGISNRTTGIWCPAAPSFAGRCSPRSYSVCGTGGRLRLAVRVEGGWPIARRSLVAVVETASGCMSCKMRVEPCRVRLAVRGIVIATGFCCRRASASAPAMLSMTHGRRPFSPGTRSGTATASTSCTTATANVSGCPTAIAPCRVVRVFGMLIALVRYPFEGIEMACGSRTSQCMKNSSTPSPSPTRRVPRALGGRASACSAGSLSSPR